MLPVDFKKYQYRISLSLIYAHVTCRIKEVALWHVTRKALSHSIGRMSHVKFKKRMCYPDDFRGQGPYICLFLQYQSNTYRDHQKPAPRHVRWEFPANMAVHEQSLSALADQTGSRVY